MSQGFTKGIPIDTDNTLSANSNFLVPSQNAVKTYADTKQKLSIKLSSQTLITASWTLVGIYYQYTFSNVNIVSTGWVDFIPNNASVLEVTSCKLLPQITAGSGSCILYSMFPPQSDIVGDIIINIL